MKLRPYPKYKDSGVEWLGKIPEEWEIKRLKYVCSKYAEYGLNIAAENYQIDGIRFIRTTDIDDYGNLKGEGVYLNELLAKGYILNSGDLLISRSGTIGRSFLYDSSKNEKATYAGYLVRYSLDEKETFPKYIFYFIQGHSFFEWLKTQLIETTISNVNGQKYANLSVTLPSLDKQIQITNYLEQKTFKIDELIKKNERLVELLKEKRQAIISQAVTKGLDPNVKMKDSGVEWLGKIPEKWRVIRLKYLINSIKIGPFGSQLKLDEMVKEGYKVYGQENIINKDFSLGQRYITEKKYKSLRACELSPGDIVITMMGTIGKCDIFPEDAKRGIMDSHLLKITSNKFTIPEFLALILENAYYVQEGVYIASKGSIMSGLNSQIIKSLLIVLPDIKEQREIMAYLNSVFKQYAMLTYKIESSIEKLKEYRQTLISNVVTGKVRVSQSHF